VVDHRHRPHGILTGLSALAHALHPDLEATTPQEEAARLALDTIGKRQAPFLLVYDNAQDPASLAEWLPTRGPRVLITSRHPDWQTQARTLPVSVMPEAEAIALLQARAGRQDDAGARRLARELGYLPLALDQAGAYAKLTLVSFDDYANFVESLIGRAGPGRDATRTVSATLGLAIARVPAAAEDMLARFAWYAPEAIPLLLLDKASMIETTEAVAALVAVSLVTRADDTAAGPAVTVHRLVQTVMRQRLAERGADAAAREQATARLAAVFPKDAFRAPAPWPRCRALLQHVSAMSAKTPPADATATLAYVLGETDSFLDGSGDTKNAVVFSRRALEIRERVLGAEHPQTLTSVNNLASCLRALGDAAAALPLYRRALESRERVLGAEHPASLTSVNNLAACLEALGDATAALPLYQRALESRERVLGAEHPATLTSVNNLAGCLEALGDAAGALPLFRRALESRESVLGAEHPDTLTSVNNLAYCLQMQGDAAAALPLYRRALDGIERLYGPNHPSTRTIRQNLENAERDSGGT
jgi:tetratricopeptide (TPR) repeat protein